MFAQQGPYPLGHLPSPEGSSFETILTLTLTSNSLHTQKVSLCWALTCVPNSSTLSFPKAHTSTSLRLPAALMSFPLARLVPFTSRLLSATVCQFIFTATQNQRKHTVCILSGLPMLSLYHYLRIWWLAAELCWPFPYWWTLELLVLQAITIKAIMNIHT